jgi:hypothetical protein
MDPAERATLGEFDQQSAYAEAERLARLVTSFPTTPPAINGGGVTEYILIEVTEDGQEIDITSVDVEMSGNWSEDDDEEATEVEAMLTEETLS